MSQSAVSVRYTDALIDAAEDQGVLDTVADDVQAVLDLLGESDELAAFIADPIMRSERKRTVLSSLLSGKVHAVTLNFLLLVCDNNRARLLKDMLADFVSTLEAKRGIVTAQVTVADTLATEQEQQLINKLSAYSGKQVRLQTTVDASLKAGFIARLGDQVFDCTLATQLNRLRNRLAAGV